MDERFFNWYAQVTDAATTDIAVLLEAFNNGVTPEEMNERNRA